MVLAWATASGERPHDSERPAGRFDLDFVALALPRAARRQLFEGGAQTVELGMRDLDAAFGSARLPPEAHTRATTTRLPAPRTTAAPAATVSGGALVELTGFRTPSLGLTRRGQ
jgi:hypothetical protein